MESILSSKMVSNLDKDTSGVAASDNVTEAMKNSYLGRKLTGAASVLDEKVAKDLSNAKETALALKRLARVAGGPLLG